jgi:predicted membrane protein (TIGR00267 family)
VMGGAFGIGALVPIAPFLILDITAALPAAVVLTGAVLFGFGVVKSRWTRRPALASGIEVLALAAMAGIVGYLVGGLLPQLQGVAGLTV